MAIKVFGILLAVILPAAFAAIFGSFGAEAKGMWRKELFGKMPDGQVVDLYTLTNARGGEVRIITYGGIVVSLKAPDRNGNLGDVVLGFDKLDDYLKGHPFFGAIVGRYGNRIGKARFTLNGVEYKLAANNGENSLHGGIRGFDKAVWKARPSSTGNGVALVLTYLSRDGEEGYPGNLSTTITYTWTDDHALRIDYSATTDRDTVVNLTHHSYFNLSGAPDILSHVMQINADRFTPVDGGLIPTGELRSVRGTALDFTSPVAIGARIDQDDEQLKLAGGYDHNFVINRKNSDLTQAARVTEPETGRVMEVWTTKPGVQFYTGNFLDGSLKGKGGAVYKKRSGFCLETQHFPDSPNKPEFPSTVLKKGARYRSTTVYRFSAQTK